jgi:class 3 adenylate cyclase
MFPVGFGPVNAPHAARRREPRWHGRLEGGMTTPIVVVRSPNRQRLVLVLEARTEVGRECDGLLVPDPRMSRRHLALEPAPDGSVHVTDLQSSNGTIVDGTRLSHPVSVPTGGVVWAGDTQITIGAAADARASVETPLPGATDTTQRSSIEAVAEEVSVHLRPELIGVRDEPGTLTVVFTDIEGSTGMAVLLGDELWFKRLSQHQSLVKDHAAANDGRIVKGQGDGFMLCFRSARQGLLFAIGLERDLERAVAEASDPVIRVRVGLHTGEVLVADGGDLIGRHVVVAARIANLAVGGEILASALVKQIAEPRGDIRFIDPRQVQLKGIEGSETVYSVDWRSFGT